MPNHPARALATEWAPRLLSVLRIVTALIFLLHGTQKLFGFPQLPEGLGAPAAFSLFWIAAEQRRCGDPLLLRLPLYRGRGPGSLERGRGDAERRLKRLPIGRNRPLGSS
jgi:hypothetical protein